MPPVKLDSSLKADVINGRMEMAKMAEEEALADSRVWGQCLFAELHMFESALNPGSSQLDPPPLDFNQTDRDEMICSCVNENKCEETSNRNTHAFFPICMI